ncbi:S41 family peptidase [Caulobacter sp. 1776]|uniref:S41 family peptidase n=1 Tax=Caulobacter sp. 1776 TaxID=3156420 RepID=UPI0033969791
MRRNLVIAIGASLALATLQPVLAQEQPPPPAPAPVAASPADYAAAIESLAGKLETAYVEPAQGQRYAAMLRANKATYIQITDPMALAKRLTDDLRAVHPDNHLRVALGSPDGGPGGGPRRMRIGPGPAPGPGPGPGPGGPRPPAIEDPKWIADGVAYIKFNMFDGAPETLATLDAFMKEHADAKAIIFDARTHRGGGPAEMNVMLPYLYAQPTRLVSMDMAQSVVDMRGDPTRGDPNMRPVSAPKGVNRREHWVTPNAETRLRDAKVFYLTSTRTGSAAEHLALAFKRTHRAILVGEHTGGANHFGGFEPLGAGLAAFIPVGRTFDPDTDWDWEGVGIQPDVAVPADQALDKALELAKG